jgi:hypothetical protein
VIFHIFEFLQPGIIQIRPFGGLPFLTQAQLCCAHIAFISQCQCATFVCDLTPMTLSIAPEALRNTAKKTRQLHIDFVL